MENERSYYFARQPILNREKKIVAYELLYRDSAHSQCSGPMPENATERVLVNVLNMAGLGNLLENDTKAYINIDRQMLFSNTIESIPKQHFIFELLETIHFTPEIVERVKELYELGYTFALDDIICSREIIEEIRPVLPYVDIIKLDLPLQPITSIKPYINLFKSMKLLVLAEKVEKGTDYEEFYNLGCDLFQGFFFARPTLVSGKKIDTRLALIFRVINLLSLQRHDEALDAFEQDASLTIQLLRYINSAAFSFRNDIRSIQQAAALLGDHHLKQWLTMMSYTVGSDEGARSPLLELAQERANFMYLLASHCIGTHAADDAAFIGLLSLVDALFGKPMDELLHELHIDQHIIDILSGDDQSRVGTIYNLVCSVEALEQEQSCRYRSALGLSFPEFAALVHQSYERAEAFNESLNDSD